VELLKRSKSLEKNKLHAEASIILNGQIQFLVIGPTRVGKSTLIKAVTGMDILTSGSLDSCTKQMDYYDIGNIRIWDTPGFEKWGVNDIDSMWKKVFQVHDVLPVFCLFCVSKGAFANTETIKYMFDTYIQKYKIPICWTITNAGSCDDQSTISLMSDGKRILGPTEKVIREAIAWKLVNGYLVRVNSINSEYTFMNQKLKIPSYGIPTLIKIITTNISKDAHTHLIQMYKDKQGYWGHLAAGLFEVLYHTGLPVESLLDDKEKELFKKIAGEKLIDKIL